METNRWFLLGPWLEAPKRWAGNSAEEEALEYDAHSILTTWGDRSESTDLHDYANKDWASLVGTLYSQRWRLYFESLDRALKTNGKSEPIDWFTVEYRWNREPDHFALAPNGDAYAQASAIYSELRGQRADWSKASYVY
ncbi:MAG: alpha-N-acetylglucosaminidase C-terminal domain-containing protein [Acidobacteriaceae bacterium]